MIFSESDSIMDSVMLEDLDNFTSMKIKPECDFCIIDVCNIGIKDIEIKSTEGYELKPKKKRKQTNFNDHILSLVQRGSQIQYKMGNGKYTYDSEEAKIHLIKRNYP